MSKLNIVMAAFNQFKMTDRSICSILKNTNLDFKLIVVNNGSTDETSDMIQKYINDIVYVEAEKNEGCGIGRNIGLRLLDDNCEYVILVDNDIYTPVGWAEKLIYFMEKHPEIGLGGPATNFAGSPQLIDNVPNLETDEEIEEFSKNYKSDKEYSTVPYRWPVIGFCQIVRKSIYDKIGLFDENFKLYGCEDNDFCYRTEREGWQLAYIDSIFVYHHGHGGLGLLGDEGSLQWSKNRDYFEEKHGFI